jgi:hypothetical protein
MPTGCKSEYLEEEKTRSAMGFTRPGGAQGKVPAGNLEGGAEDLGANEFGHNENEATFVFFC